MTDSKAISKVLTPGEIAIREAAKTEDAKAFELAQREAAAYASSDLVPKEYQGKVQNVLVAWNMAKRMNADPLAVMQSLHIIHGRPGFSAKFLIAAFNQCGRFSAIRYKCETDAAGNEISCVAYATEKETGDVIEGVKVTLEMAEDEGWATKSGSKWKTMPSLMLRYRAAAFLVRTTAPEICLGMQTDDEIRDTIDAAGVSPSTGALTVADFESRANSAIVDAEPEPGNPEAETRNPEPNDGSRPLTPDDLLNSL